jgi:hypothetical protein
MKISRFLLPIALFCFLLAASPAKATTVYALTTTGALLTFDHATPGTITNNVTVSGLGGYELLAIDVRPTVQTTPANPGAGTLWGIGRSGTNFQLFVINPATGVATVIGFPIAAGINSVPGSDEWGFDFNPATDRIRLVNSSGANNYRLNPNANAALDFTDTSLAYAVGDPNAPTAPQVDAAAYSTTAFGGTTKLYYIDSNLNILAASASPDSGQLQTIGPLGTDIDQPNGFDIFGGLALFSVPGITGSSLYSVNLTTGAAAPIGAFPLLTNVRGLAISISDPVPPPPDMKPVVTVFGSLKKTTKNSRYDLRFRATDDSGIVVVSFRQVRQSPSFKIIRKNTGGIYTAIVRRLVFGNNPVNVRAIDPAGHQTTVKVMIQRNH